MILWKSICYRDGKCEHLMGEKNDVTGKFSRKYFYYSQTNSHYLIKCKFVVIFHEIIPLMCWTDGWNRRSMWQISCFGAHRFNPTIIKSWSCCFIYIQRGKVWYMPATSKIQNDVIGPVLTDAHVSFWFLPFLGPVLTMLYICYDALYLLLCFCVIFHQSYFLFIYLESLK